MTDQQLYTLLDRYLTEELSAEEKLRLQEMLAADGKKEALEQYIDNYISHLQNDELLENPAMLQDIQEKLAIIINSEGEKTPGPVRRMHFLRRGFFRYAAAVILLLLGAGAYFWIAGRKDDQLAIHDGKQPQKNIAPGRDGAVLTLADGTHVVLDSLNNGVIATQNGTQVVLNTGVLTYDAVPKTLHETAYNTMRTPKGRQFQLVLPDGSKVWLNAASSIKYPIAFTGRERLVEVEGEAYFEVARNTKMPFRIKVGEATSVEVLGTRFNINAYNNEEAIKTTLLEGAVKVQAYEQAQTLKPGQQALVTPSRQLKVIDDANIDKAIAWKNGIFNFEDASLHEVMNQLERWYDIEVVYENGVPDVDFLGKLDRHVSLSAIIEVLEKSNIHFRIEDRKLIVLP